MATLLQVSAGTADGAVCGVSVAQGKSSQAQQTFAALACLAVVAGMTADILHRPSRQHTASGLEASMEACC